jgi:hypothetical protein
VRAARARIPDWRDPAAYASLLGAERSLFAWEWLRRDPLYVEAATRALSGADHEAASAAAAFGLVRFEPPHRNVPDARPLWTSRAHAHVLPVVPGDEARPEEAFDTERFAGIATLAANGQGEHLLLADGLRSIRLDGPRGTFSEGPVCLSYQLSGLAAAERPLLALRRLLALCRSGEFPHSLYRREARARRWILLLRAHDALAAGAGQREIAGELLSRSVREPRWRTREPSMRSQAQRLVRSARHMASGGYRVLLR